MSRAVVFTAGGRGLTPRKLLALLEEAEARWIVDVRLDPELPFLGSMRGSRLRAVLFEHGVTYVKWGERLSLDSDQPPPEFERSDPLFREALEWLVQTAERGERPVLLGDSSDPFRCHRHWLVGQALLARGVPVVHLLGDGRRLECSPDLWHAARS